MKLEGQSYEYVGMRRIDQLMRDYFKDSIKLVKYWGPVQMCVFYLEYEYVPMNYKIIVECERGIFNIEVVNQDEKRFFPYMIYPGINYYHYEDRIEDVKESVSLTHKAISKNEIVFLDDKEIMNLDIEFYDKKQN